MITAGWLTESELEGFDVFEGMYTELRPALKPVDRLIQLLVHYHP